MKLTRAQSQRLLQERGIWVTNACDKCGQLLGSVRWTRKDEPGEWCNPTTLKVIAGGTGYLDSAVNSYMYSGSGVAVTAPCPVCLISSPVPPKRRNEPDVSLLIPESIFEASKGRPQYVIAETFGGRDSKRAVEYSILFGG